MSTTMNPSSIRSNTTFPFAMTYRRRLHSPLSWQRTEIRTASEPFRTKSFRVKTRICFASIVRRANCSLRAVTFSRGPARIISTCLRWMVAVTNARRTPR
uniref:Uncharacterized protein n=1 Tax=Cacopsylla melanoneura TaxID=428564 RepID=A0A8D8YZ24_9HEMI